MKIVLIGFMGSGKSTISKLLKNELKLPLFDTDEMVEDLSKMKIEGIFSTHGEIAFREFEMEVCKKLGQIESGIISTGGGVVTNKINIDYLRVTNSQVISLACDFATISSRISKQVSVVRPLFQNIGQAKNLYKIRRPLYKAYSDIEIDTGAKSTKDVVAEIIRKLNLTHDQ